MENLKGVKFGRLTVIGKTPDKHHYWNCICDCGNAKSIAQSSLVHGVSRSCGCYRKEKMKESKTTHGLSSERRLHNIWSKMKRRCKGTDKVASPYYHDRGITYCKDWNDFENFYNWSIENGYSEELTLDRIDNDGDYRPENCRWVDMKVQSRNRRGNRIITIDGVSKCLSEWCEIYDIKVSTVKSRLYRGMGEIEALTKPLRSWN